MDKISIRSMLAHHIMIIERYIKQVAMHGLPCELAENLQKIQQAKNLFTKQLKQLPTNFSSLDEKSISVLCHDLRNSINGIGGYTELCLNLIDELNWPLLKTQFQIILAINNELVQLVNNIHHPNDRGVAATLEETTENSEKITGSILIVEDNEANRDLLSNWLTVKGCQVYTAGNGDEALTMVAKHSDIDVVLLDILMSGKDGFVVLNEIRANKDYNEIAIIMLTALNDVNNIVRCVKMGADDYLIKPYNAFLLEAKIKSTIEKKLLRYQNLIHARQVGMADVAIHILHNVGNFLNSINVTASLMTEKIKNSEISELSTIKIALEEHNKNNLTDFLINDERGKAIPAYISALADYWQQEQTEILDYLSDLNEKIQLIIDLVTSQQSWDKNTGLIERVDLEEIVETAIALQKEVITDHNISIQRNFIPLDPIVVDKIKLLHIFINLIINANESLIKSQNKNKTIEINFKVIPEDKILIQFIDNGVGIATENITKIFSQGFSTKKVGRGYGAHGSALAANDLGGVLMAESDGIGKGACFNLILPLSRTH